MNYTESIDWLYSLQQFGVKLGLENITKLLSALGQPQNRYESILIGGTNGKGSIGAMLQSILSTSGYKTGLYTSPHLTKVEERIRIGYRDISSKQLANALSKVKSVTEELLKNKMLSQHPTFFEVLTAAAFQLFSVHKINLAIVEVGMGGRFDATNVIRPLLSVISNIEKDHTEYLGNKLESIAYEKSGIVKQSGILVTGPIKKSPLSVVKRICNEKKSSMISASLDNKVSINADSSINLKSPYHLYKKLKIPLAGDHQIENVKIAVRVAEILSNRGYNINKEEISRGIRKTKWEGRIEWVRSKPPIILDGAHNVSAMRALSKYLSLLRKQNYEIRVIFGAMKDKDIDGMMRTISPSADSVYLTKLEMERAADLNMLYNISLNHHKIIKKCQNLRGALKAASDKKSSRVISIKNKKAIQKPVICLCGSLFLIGAFKNLKSKRKESLRRKC